MTPSGTSAAGEHAKAADETPAVSTCIKTLLNRPDYLHVARGRRHATPGFVLQARPAAKSDPDQPAVRVGITCSKKVGNAVARNRAKRRLRALAHAVMPDAGRAGWDYVLVGRAGTTVDRDFAAMRRDLENALAQVHGDHR